MRFFAWPIFTSDLFDLPPQPPNQKYVLRFKLVVFLCFLNDVFAQIVIGMTGKIFLPNDNGFGCSLGFRLWNFELLCSSKLLFVKFPNFELLLEFFRLCFFNLLYFSFTFFILPSLTATSLTTLTIWTSPSSSPPSLVPMVRLIGPFIMHFWAGTMISIEN